MEMYPVVMPWQWDVSQNISRYHGIGIYLMSVAMTMGHIRYIHLWFPYIWSVKVDICKKTFKGQNVFLDCKGFSANFMMQG